MKLSGWKYTNFPLGPRFLFDEAATGSGDAAPAAAPVPAAPSAAPAPTPGAPDSGAAPVASPSAAGATTSDSDDAFSGFDDNFSDDVIEVPVAPPTNGGAADPAAQAAPAPAATPAASPTPASPQGQQPPAAAPVTQPAATSLHHSGEPLDEAMQGFERHAKELANHAAQKIFALTDEDAAALATNAEQVIPRLMGQVYQQSILASMNLIKSFIPQMITQGVVSHTARTAKSTEAINEFYTTHPDLNAKDHGDLVKTWSKSFRQANPAATRAEAIKFVGNAVRFQAGLPPLSSAPAPAARPTAFAPARHGARTPPLSAEHDPYSGLGEDHEN